MILNEYNSKWDIKLNIADDTTQNWSKIKLKKNDTYTFTHKSQRKNEQFPNEQQKCYNIEQKKE